MWCAIVKRKIKCWPFDTEDGSSIDTPHYKVAVSDFKCED